jgi:hypothetical protein
MKHGKHLHDRLVATGVLGAIMCIKKKQALLCMIPDDFFDRGGWKML